MVRAVESQMTEPVGWYVALMIYGSIAIWWLGGTILVVWLANRTPKDK